jgi:hypothetical protein
VIDSTTEALLPLAHAAELLPRRRRGRKAHVSTLHRWATVGCRGIVLETLQVGGTRCTSAEALQRFFESLTRGASPMPVGNTSTGSSRTSSRRQRDSETAERLLKKLGA